MIDDSTTTLADLRHLMRTFVSERQWEKHHTPKNLAASVAIESAELLELFQWLTPEEGLTKSFCDPSFREKVSDELADVFLYLVSMANALELDVSASVVQKLAKNRLKYPIKASFEEQATAL